MNVLTGEKVRELGLPMVKSEVKCVKGFDGQDSKVFGQCELEVKFGPYQGVKKQVFLVCQNAMMSILGIPALQQFYIDINYGNRTLIDRKSGRVAFCEIVCEKNE